MVMILMPMLMLVIMVVMLFCTKRRQSYIFVEVRDDLLYLFRKLFNSVGLAVEVQALLVEVDVSGLDAFKLADLLCEIGRTVRTVQTFDGHLHAPCAFIVLMVMMLMLMLVAVTFIVMVMMVMML